MPRRRKTYDAIATRLAFLSISESPEAKTKADAIVWTLRESGVSDDVIQEIVEKAEQLAEDAAA